MEALGLGVNCESGEGGILGSVRLSWSRAPLHPCHRMQDAGFFFSYVFVIFNLFMSSDWKIPYTMTISG